MKKIGLTAGTGLVVALGLQYHLWFADHGVLHMTKLKQQIVAQETKNQIIKDEQQSMLGEIARLRQDVTAIESLARSDLGMIKKGEVFYQFVK